MKYAVDMYPVLAQDEENLSTDLLRDFYQSFRLAQNEPAIQPPLFERLAEQHQKLGNTALLPTAIHIADKSVDKLLPPKNHRETDAASRNNKLSGFRAMWTDYVLYLEYTDQTSGRSDEDLLNDMIFQDNHYQEYRRPSRTGKADPHASMVRECILGEALTGSKYLMAVRNQLRNSLLFPSGEDGAYMVEQLTKLVPMWEAHHPDQTFITPNI